MEAVLLSLGVSLAATLLSLPVSILAAWYLERSRGPARGVVQTLIMMPLVLPPVVVGYLLLGLFSPRGALGRALAAAGMPVAFHWLGAVVAAAVVGFPLFVMMIAQAMKGVDPRLEVVSRSLGRTRWGTFFRVTLPLSWPGLLSGAALAFGRGLGEFGATIILAGRIPGETETIPLAIYARLESPGGEREAGILVAAAVVLCLAAVVASRVLDRWHRSRLELDR
ncbi:MAG TPA: molybdate ABC transporter permease subunit [Planctomycetota bacterium]|nr:molybdate ABC transporter permease subunit [Planctomycetota bacterium]